MTSPDQHHPHDDDAEVNRRSYVALAFIALLVVASVWLVNKCQENSQLVECMESGHHDCVPLDTSVKGR